MAMSESAVVRELNRLRQRLDRVERGQRYAHGGSIENSALEVRDDGGSLRAIVGQQADGTTGVNVTNGPTPPVPSAPTVEPALAALTVTWDGTFADDIAAPLDWMRCEVHIGPDAGFTPGQGTLRDTIESPQGGSVVVPLPYTEWHVKLRSRTTSGVASEPTAAVAGTPRQAEAADITAGSIIAEHIAVDAITGKTITGGTVTGATVQTAESGARVTLDTAMKLYNSAGELLAEATPSAQVAGGIYDTDPAFICYNTYGFGAYWVMLSRGFIRFGREDLTYHYPPVIDHIVTGTNSSEMILDSGDMSTTSGSAILRLSSSQPGSSVSTARLYSGAMGGTCDLDVTGIFTAGNMAAGRVSITPAANTPTSMSVTGLDVKGSDHFGYATALSGVPGTTVQEVSVSGVSSTGITVWLYRTNTTTTSVYWQVIGAA